MNSAPSSQSPKRRVSIVSIFIVAFVLTVVIALVAGVALVVTGNLKPPAVTIPTTEAPAGGGGRTPPPPPLIPSKPPPTVRANPQYAKVVPVAITPAKLDGGPKEVSLPGKVVDSCVGGGGRFFVLHLQLSDNKRQLAIFDVSQAKVVKSIDLPGENVKIAAGMSALMIADVDKGVYIRYSLATFEREMSSNLLVTGTVRHMGMGSASAGPLLIGMNTENTVGGGTLHFVDPNSFAVLAIDQKGGKPFPAGDDQTHYRVRPDGKAFTVWNSVSTPPDLRYVTVNGRNAEVHTAPIKVDYAVPAPGDVLHTATGLLTRELKEKEGEMAKGHVVPAAEGSLYLRLVGAESGTWNVEVRAAGDDRPKFTIKSVGTLTVGDKQDFTLDKRVHFVPTAKLLVVVSASNDKLLLYPYES